MTRAAWARNRPPEAPTGLEFRPMALGVRLGPFRVSSSGRVGVSAGPFSVSGGGRRRRKRGGGGGGVGPIGALFLISVVIAVVVVVVMWPLSLWGHAIHLTPSWHQLMNRNHVWMHEHYPLVGLRYVGAAFLLLLVIAAAAVPFLRLAVRQAAEREREADAHAAEQQRQAAAVAAERDRRISAQSQERQRQADLAHQQWLAGPAPPLQMPGRFTQNWLAANVPALHPGQVPPLLDELRARGWTDERIQARVAPLLNEASGLPHQGQPSGDDL